MKPAKTDYDKAQKRANKAEANRLAQLLKKLDRDLAGLQRKQCFEELSARKAIARKEKQNRRILARANRATEREKQLIYRRLQILNGRGL